MRLIFCGLSIVLCRQSVVIDWLCMCLNGTMKYLDYVSIYLEAKN
jgi:hypothetical protein